MESLSRLGQRISENIHESTRDLTFAGSTRDIFDTTEDRASIIKLLESSHEREKVEGMKRLVALISKSHDASSFFAVVVKNVSSPSLELRKLVYIFLLRYAEGEPDLALLSINTFQKDLNDPNPLIRSMSLRVLGGMRVPMIGSVVTMAIKKGSADPNPHVRKAAALAIPKLYGTDTSHHHTLLPILLTMLADRSPIVIGSVVVAFEALCPLRLDLLHPHFRRLCGMLVDADEWGQVALVELLGRYSRMMLENPKADSDDPPDSDLLLLLSNTVSLLSSSSPAVILSTVRLHHVLSPPASPLPHLLPPLLRILASHPEEGVRLAVLKSVRVLLRERKDIFEDDEDLGDDLWTRFIVGVGDGRRVCLEKIGVLAGLVGESNVKALMGEFLQYERSPDEKVSAEAINALGRCAQARPEASQTAIKYLLSLLKSKRASSVTATILVLKSLILSPTSTPSGAGSLVARLASKLTSIQNSEARSCVIWLVGEHSGDGGRIGFEVLRIGVRGFASEAPATKLSLLTLATKLLSHPTLSSPSPPRQLVLLSRHLFSLARYDADYDVRDRGRFLRGLARGLLEERDGEEGEDDEGGERGGVVLRGEQIRVVMGGGRVGGIGQGEGESSDGEPSSSSSNYPEFGTLSLLVQPHFLPSYTPLPDWLEEGTDSSLRDSLLDSSPIPQATSFSSSSAVYLQSLSSSTLKGFGSESKFNNGAGSGANSPAGSFGGAKGGRAAGAGGGGFRDLEKFYESESESSSEEEEEEEEEDDSEEEDEALATKSLLLTTKSASSEDVDSSEEEESSEEDGDEEATGDTYDRFR
ncbi:adaptin N terminal region-domain-containing protein [Mrakia frigida]|uniref:AP-3 complex subunit beta n=1 Tax=Mrakia frigida TaxID=29902 RepID=UPI003FCC0459